MHVSPTVSPSPSLSLCLPHRLSHCVSHCLPHRFSHVVSHRVSLTRLSHCVPLTLTLTFSSLQVCLPSSGRMLLAASEAGTVRSYKLPLTGEFSEYQANAGSISKMRVSSDDALMFCVGDDGALFVFDIKDKDAVKSKGGGAKGEPTPFAEEVLVTKSDLQEKQTRMAELETQVGSRRGEMS
jgi:WD40 repeat protein